MLGQSPYSASKISADQLSISYWRSFKLPVKIIRPFNTYGPRQSTRAVIPTIIIQALKEKKEIKLGNIQSSRDFTYVIDTCNAYLEILKIKKMFGIPINVGSNNEYKIKDIAKKIISKINPKIKIIIDKKRIRPNLSEVDRLRCDNSLIKKNTTWKPLFSFDNGLDETISWIKNNKQLTFSEKYRV